MTILGKRIKLEKFSKSDWPLFKELYTDPNIMKHVYDPLTEKDAKELFQSRLAPWDEHSKGWLSFSINDLSAESKLGVIGLKITKPSEKIAEVGFILTGRAQGKGFASESLGLLVKHAFDDLKLNKLVATCSIKNQGSYKVLEKQGFVREGYLPQNSMTNHDYGDDYLYALFKPGTKQKD